MNIPKNYSPPEKHLSRLYFELSKMGVRCVGEKHAWPFKPKTPEELIVLASELSRFDPRLFGVIVEYFCSHWQEWNPYRLRLNIVQSLHPAIWGVIAEFVLGFNPDVEARYFFEYLLKGIIPAQPQLFFRGIYPIGGKQVERAASESLREYRRWGFLGSERPILNIMDRKAIGTWDRTARLNILRRLFGAKNKITISDYLKELNHTISRQQALKDLSAYPHVIKTGKGRGSGWKLMASG